MAVGVVVANDTHHGSGPLGGSPSVLVPSHCEHTPPAAN